MDAYTTRARRRTGHRTHRCDRPNDSRPDRMPIRRLTRTPALPAGSLSVLLAPYGDAMRIGAHKSVGSAPNCRITVGVLSV
eukprot:5852020-Prymnesium_polylepis.1